MDRPNLMVRLSAAVFVIGMAGFVPPPSTTLQRTAISSEQVRFEIPAQLDQSVNMPVRDATARFLAAMREHNAPSVWMFASEEDQDAFGTEQAVYDAFADAFPVLTRVQTVEFQSFRAEGDTPIVDLVVSDAAKATFRATIGLWKDDAGDWKVVSCDVTPATDQVAAL